MIIAIANQAGGVGKTTTAINLGYELARRGKTVLLVDLDPQADLTGRMDAPPTTPPLETLLLTDQPAGTVARLAWEGTELAILPSSGQDLAQAELGLVMQDARERRLTTVLSQARAYYDYILIDCPPNLGLLTTNAFYAADSVLIPIQAQDKAYQAIGLVLKTIDKVNRYRGVTPLRVFGLLLTMWEHTTMAREVYQKMVDKYPDTTLQTIIPVRASTRYDGRWHAPLGVYDPKGAATTAYTELAEEVIYRAEKPAAAH